MPTEELAPRELVQAAERSSRVSAQRLRDEFLPPLLHAAAAVDRYTSSRP